MSIHLFLAHADDQTPVLPEGLSAAAAQAAPDAVRAAPPSRPYVAADPPDALPEQGWAIVAPKGPEGDRLLHLIEPLRQRRAEQQGADVVVYRVDPGMDVVAATTWFEHDYWDAVGRQDDFLPRYLLLLGGPELVPWEFQQLVAGDAFVGRLCFPDDRGYEAYVDKVLRWEAREEPAPGARAIFHTVRDGTQATDEGYAHLMRPSVTIAHERRQRGAFPATEIVEIGGGGVLPTRNELAECAQQMLREAESARGGLLFSMAHGVGVPRGGWKSPAEQRAHQGALVLGRSGARLTLADVEGRPFLPGGMWLLFACYGAGTPAHSAYYPWLQRLDALGWDTRVSHVLPALPKNGEPPFVAAIPQAALASSNGPLGVVGHVDLAWSWSLFDSDGGAETPSGRGRAEQFQRILRAAAEGHRFGVAHNEIARFPRRVGLELLTSYGENARRGIAIDSEDDARKARRARLWMQRQDLSAYVLLGDPAARLPINRYPAGIPARAGDLAAKDRRAKRLAALERLLEQDSDAGDALELLASQLPPAVRYAHALLATLESFDRAVFDAAVAPAIPAGIAPAPSFETLRAHADPAPDGGLRLEPGYAERCLERARSDESRTDPGVPTPAALADFVSGVLVGMGPSEPDTVRLRLLAAVRPAEALADFDRLFREADEAFLLARCRSLCDAVRGRPRIGVEGDEELDRAVGERQIHLHGRVASANDFYRTGRYYRRADLHERLERWLAGGPWVLELHAKGGWAKRCSCNGCAHATARCGSIGSPWRGSISIARTWGRTTGLRTACSLRWPTRSTRSCRAPAAARRSARCCNPTAAGSPPSSPTISSRCCAQPSASRGAR